jgi:hypothetical protein
VLATPSGLRWIDFERCCRGPVEADLAYLGDTGTRRPGVDLELLTLTRQMLRVSVATICWCDPDRHPRLREAAEHHLAAFVEEYGRPDRNVARNVARATNSRRASSASAIMRRSPAADAASRADRRPNMIKRDWALGVLAAVVLIGYTGVLVKLQADARSAPFTGPSADDVSKVWRDRWTDVEKIANGTLDDVGCDANAGTRTFTCHIFLSAGGKHGLRMSAVVRPTSYCTGTKGCMMVDNLYFAIGRTRESGDVTLALLWAGVD